MAFTETHCNANTRNIKRIYKNFYIIVPQRKLARDIECMKIVEER